MSDCRRWSTRRGHPYHHPVIGSMEDIDAATLEDVASFFETFYVPNNAVITLAGDFDSGEALGLINQYFADIPRGADVPPLAKDPTVAPLIGETVRQVVVSDVPLPRVIMAFRIPPFSSDDFAVAEVAQALLGQGRAARLYRRLVRERRVAKSVGVLCVPALVGSFDATRVGHGVSRHGASGP